MFIHTSNCGKLQLQYGFNVFWHKILLWSYIGRYKLNYISARPVLVKILLFAAFLVGGINLLLGIPLYSSFALSKAELVDLIINQFGSCSPSLTHYSDGTRLTELFSGFRTACKTIWIWIILQIYFKIKGQIYVGLYLLFEYYD